LGSKLDSILNQDFISRLSTIVNLMMDFKGYKFFANIIKHCWA